jgi:Secretion system C-terminal sorting domain
LVQLHLVSPKDSSLFYLEIPEGAAGNFWQVTTMAQYSLQFVNISNVLWYAQRKVCTVAYFSATVINKSGNCFTRLTTTASAANLNWEVNDMGRILKYNNQSVVDLPDYISPNALITLTSSTGCVFSSQLNNNKEYLRAKEACVSGAAMANIETSAVTPLMYPNPSTGVFKCMQKGNIAIADEIVIYNTQGNHVCSFKNTSQFNISNATAGLYLYRMIINGEVFKGKLVKL